MVVRKQEERDLDSLIEDQLWEEAHTRFQSHPEEASIIVNPSLGWSKLHWLCSMGSTPASLLDLVTSLHPEAVTQPDNRYGDTPLHIICRNSQTSDAKVRILLKYCAEDGEGVLIRNRFGGTALHSASNHNATLGTLKALIDRNPRILRVTTHEGIHAVSALWHAYMQTIPGYMITARILKGEHVEEDHFERFWQKTVYLATEYFRQSPSCPADLECMDQHVLHGLLQCSAPIGLFKLALKRNANFALAPDNFGNLPLHVLVATRPYRLKEKEAIEALLEAAPQAVSVENHDGNIPLLIAIHNKIPWENGIDSILATESSIVSRRDVSTGLYPFQVAASVGGKVAINTTYHLLSTMPDLATSSLEK